MKRLLSFLFIVVIIIAGIAIIHHKREAIKNLPAPGQQPIPVITTTVRAGEVSRTIKTVAVIESETAATVSAQVPGTLLDVLFHEGDNVRKGAVMARIDPRILTDAVHSAEARLEAAKQKLETQKAIFERDKALYEAKAIAQQAFDVSKAMFDAVKASEVTARKALESAKTRLSYTAVTAPYTGTVASRLVEPGDLATPGKPIYRIQVSRGVKLLSKLSQSDLTRLKVGGKVLFRDGGKTLEAEILRIYPALDRSHLGSVETVLTHSPFGLPAGAIVSAEYSAVPATGHVVPESALLEGINETLVIRIKDNKADPVPVTINARGGDYSTVTGDINDGDIVVTGLPSELMALTAGTPIQRIRGDSQ